MLAEHNLYTRFHELTRERMTLLISHRCSTVRMADRILVLEHGRIVEDGSHAALPAPCYPLRHAGRAVPV